ncbi:fimbrial protein [Entomohabitans teleogrylli]|uniref:fimbrial protein n=1 Tax=Entomohabitans teleogrylli TaxID=1384589 RepID=UPI00073D35E5|nr:fimbrial protein [Entomohabitans teleogrylli]
MKKQLTGSLCYAIFGIVALPASVFAAEGDTTLLNVSGVIVDAPTCTVNGNDVVDVDFGNSIVTRKIDGEEYKQPVRVELECESPQRVAMKLAISGDSPGFGSGLIRTSKSGLGIRLFNGTTPLASGSWVNFTYPTVPSLYAAPVAQNNATLTGGPFSGTATLVINYQ